MKPFCIGLDGLAQKVVAVAVGMKVGVGVGVALGGGVAVSAKCLPVATTAFLTSSPCRPLT